MKKFMTIAAAMIATFSVAGTVDSASAKTPIESIVENIKGHWEANDLVKKGRIVKFFTINRIASFEDEIEPGTLLTGTLHTDDTGADIVLQYVTGFQCRYKLSFKAGADAGSEMTFRLVNSNNPSDNKRFKCVEGRLERIQKRPN